MDQGRFVLTDRTLAVIAPLGPGRAGAPGRTGTDNRLFVEAVLWIVSTDAPWRNLPREFGNWNGTFRRVRRCMQADVCKRLLDALSGEPDMEYAMIDAIIVKVRRHGICARGDSEPRPSASRRAAGRPRSPPCRALDKASDCHWIIEEMEARDAEIVISQHPQRKAPSEIDAEMYRWRHLIENYFKRTAMRSEKTDATYAAMIYLCSGLINSP